MRNVFFSFARNGTIFILKVAVWRLTGSSSMFAESIHSVADTANQIILAFGIHRSVKVNKFVCFIRLYAYEEREEGVKV